MKRETRRIINRKGEATCDICKKPNILHSHHIRGREILNANHFSNIANVCPNCRMDIHYGVVIIEKWLMTSDGYKLFYHKKGEESFTGDDATPNLLVEEKH